MPPKKKMKVECLECGALFDQYYRKTHNEKQHQDLLRAHRVVRYKAFGAPANPFEEDPEGYGDGKERVAEDFQSVNDDKEDEPSTSGMMVQQERHCLHDKRPEGDGDGHPRQGEDIQSSDDDYENAPRMAVPCKGYGQQGEIHGMDEVEDRIVGELRATAAKTAHSVDEPREALDIFTCAAQLKNIISFANNAQEMVCKVEDAHDTSHQNLLADIEEFASSMAQKARTLKESCSKPLARVERLCDLSEEDIRIAATTHDSARRPEDMTFEQKLFLIRTGPHQPKLPVFPRNGQVPKGKQSRFNPDWYTIFPHLEYSIETDSAFCFVCSLFPIGPNRGKTDQTWGRNEVRAWHRMMSVGKKKDGKLQQHFSSTAHSAALEDYMQCAMGADIGTLMNHEARKLQVQKEFDLTRNKEVITVLLDIVRTMSRLGLAFRGETDNDSNFHQLTQLVSRHCGVLQKWFQDRGMRPYRVTYCSPESQNEFIALLAAAVYVRYVDEDGQPKERLVGIKELMDKTGAGHAASLLESIEKNGMDSSKTVFQ
ncbi:hypothetical protein HOLleu_40451 [Holothuria leucospilota]|uniref:TTF-type domain-containing protein n=1 Tax=Holothuria leucospilota TaxID=206669 RepID=A0A9Q0YFU1_HOLLE|nr:hypothetical protein HOLleu_40451 [Holothuria leucospilota]